MIINHQYHFCFFAIPRTASTAISTLLVEKYSSTTLLNRHSSYRDFLEQANDSEKLYYKFASIRNPLDSVVSAYFKKKTNHNNRFSRGTFKNGRPIGQRAMEEFHFIVDNNASFQKYFLKFYSEPFKRPRHEDTVRHMDALIRFEHLNEDFENITRKLGLPFYPIPYVNPTADREKDFLQFYTPDIIPQALIVFEQIMKDWGYDFPSSWQQYQ